MTTFSPHAFSRFLRGAAVKHNILYAGAIERFGKAVLKEARASIGNPDLLMPYLAPATQADRIAKGFSPDKTFLRTGEMKDSYSMEFMAVPGGATAIVGSWSMKAYWGEYGRIGVRGGKPQPPRPVLGGALARVSNKMYDEIYLSVPGALISMSRGMARYDMQDYVDKGEGNTVRLMFSNPRAQSSGDGIEFKMFQMPTRVK